MPPGFASSRHVLPHTHKNQVADGLLALKEGKPGYKVWFFTMLVNALPESIAEDALNKNKE